MKKWLIALLLLATLQSDSQVSDNQIVLYKRRVVAGVESQGGGAACTQYTDNFNRGDSADVGGLWTPVDGQGQIVSMSVTAWDGNDFCERYNDIFWNANQSSSAKITAQTIADLGTGYGVSCRCSSSANTYIRVIINGDGEWECGRKVAGAYTFISNGTTTYSAGAVLKMTVTGVSPNILIVVVYNGSQILSTTINVAALDSGAAGIAYSSAATGTIDDWEGCDNVP